MKSYRFLPLLLPFFLAACGLSPQQKADYARVQSSGVSPAIYDKMLHDDDLSIHDVEVLSEAHVNSGIILRYIRDQDSVYFLNTSDITGMEKAGVDHSIIDYMLQTARGGYWGSGPYPYYGGFYGGDPFFWGPGFYGGGFYGGYYGGFRGGYGHGGYGGHHH